MLVMGDTPGEASSPSTTEPSSGSSTTVEATVAGFASSTTTQTASTVPAWASNLAASLPKPVTFDPRAEVIDSDSAILGLRRRFYVYTPSGYTTGTERLPVIYLFRGHEREWINAKEDSTRDGKTVIDVYEDLLLNKEVGPLILVFPGVASDDNRWSGMLVNARQAQLPAVKGALGNGRWEDYFLHELIPYIDSHYRTDPTARAVDGFSLGGFMSVKIAAQHPTLFRSVGAYDGTFLWDDPKDPHGIATTDNVFGMPIFDPIWGKPRDRRFAAANNPLNLVRNGDPAVLSKLQWLIAYGPRSAEPSNSNYYRGNRLRRLLAERGIPNIGGAIRGGVHTWRQADAHMRRNFPLHWAKLSDAR